jgi:hypothetical protein
MAEAFADGAADANALWRAQRWAQAAARLFSRRREPLWFHRWLASLVAAVAAAKRVRFDPQKEFFRGAADREGRTERKARAELVRELFGNPFRPAAAPAWRVGEDSTALRLAQAIYRERRFADLPILADALEEAGCDHADALAHCRSGGEHVCGCWVVDLLLGKA